MQQQINTHQGDLHRLEAHASELARETTDARDEMEAERDGAIAEAAANAARLAEAEKAVAAMDDRSLSALVSYLAPRDGPARERADALLKIRSLDALPSSEKSVDEKSERHRQYKQAVNTLVDGLLAHVGDGDDERTAMLESAVLDHLSNKSRKRKLPSESAPAPAPPVGVFLDSIALMWQKAKLTRDYVGARQALSLLILPPEHPRTSTWTYAHITALVSDVKSISVGDKVLVNVKGRNSRSLGVVSAVNNGSEGATFSIAPPTEVATRGRASCTVMTNVPAHKVEHVDSLICRIGEVGVARRGVRTLAARSPSRECSPRRDRRYAKSRLPARCTHGDSMGEDTMEIRLQWWSDTGNG